MPLQTDKTSKGSFILVDEEHIGQRLDNFLFTRLKGLPKSRVYRAIRHGEIRVNKKRIKPEYRLQQNDQIRIPPLRLASTESKAKPSTQLLQLMQSAIIYEDRSLLIINKPSGIASHGGSGINFGVIELLRHLRPKLKYLELVHRLDRETTGCLMLAKKASILKELHEMLRQGQIQKTYLALVHGQWQGESRRINAPLLKNVLQSGERVVKVHTEGKPATTQFRPLRIFKNTSLIEAKPKTGRTHQIRVHAASIDHPILGDDKYLTAEYKKSGQHKVKHLMLHASSLRFHLRSTQEDIAICACLDEAFYQALKESDHPARG